MQTEHEFFITSGGVAIGPSYPSWIDAKLALLKLVNDGAAELVIEKHEIDQPNSEQSADFREVLEHPIARGKGREWLAAR